MQQVIIALATAIGVFLAFRGGAADQPAPRFVQPRSSTPVFDKAPDPEDNPVTLTELYEKHGRQKDVNPLLLQAIARVESGENPSAENPSDPSTGLMQVLCAPGPDGVCQNSFNIDGWPATKSELFDPDRNLHFAAQILAWNQQRYGFIRGIAVYNAWSARKASPDGPFPNQDYVDKVLAEFRALGGQVPGNDDPPPPPVSGGVVA